MSGFPEDPSPTDDDYDSSVQPTPRRSHPLSNSVVARRVGSGYSLYALHEAAMVGDAKRVEEIIRHGMCVWVGVCV